MITTQNMISVTNHLTPTAPFATRQQQGESGSFALYESLVMIVDDEPLYLDVMRAHLEELGYHRMVTTCDANEALPLLRQHSPDVLLLDVKMPYLDGFDVLSAINADPQVRGIPVLIVTSITGAAAKHRALELGAADLLFKPVDPCELGLRLKNTLRAKAHRDSLVIHSAKLENEVRERTRQLEEAQQQIIHCLARAAEFRDDDTGKHVFRVGRHAAILASGLGIDPREVELLEMAAQLHDIGKIGIPDDILLKPGKFEPAEFAVMKQHCELGVSILSSQPPQAAAASAELDAVPVLRLAMVIAATHHERWDGSGYPRGLRGSQIPLAGRIVAVADVFDALTSQRPYKPPVPLDKSLAILREGSGSHFDPQLIEVFFSSLDRILSVRTLAG